MDCYLKKCFAIVYLVVLFVTHGFGQLDGKQGTVCFLDDEHGPKVLCSMSSLNMSSGEWIKLPDGKSKGKQPSPLCFESSGPDATKKGQPDNIVWYAFEAESEILDLDVHIRRCKKGDGIQFGLLSSCNFADMESRLYCISDIRGNRHNINVRNLIVGKTYYLFIDGDGGDVCEYRFELKNPSTTFDLKDLDVKLSNKDIADKRTLCTGITTDFVLDHGTSIPLKHTWNISHNGKVVTKDSITTRDTLTRVFSTPGKYKIEVFSSNDCSRTNKKSIEFEVKDLAPEVFGQIEVCYDCVGEELKSLDSRCITEGNNINEMDPNNDGVKGWIGDLRIKDVRHDKYSRLLSTVQLPNGCSYEQNIEVRTNGATTNPATKRDTLVCRLPFIFNGTTVHKVGDTFTKIDSFTHDNGCHSRIQYRVDTIIYDANVVITCTEDGKIIPKVIYGGRNNFHLLEGVKPIYNWYTSDGSPLESNILKKNTSYYVTIDLGGNGCTSNPIYFKTDDLAPTTATPKSFEACKNDEWITLGMPSIEGYNYEWEVPVSNHTFVNEGKTDTIRVKNPGTNFKYYVKAVSKCGTGDKKEAEISMLSVSSSFSIPKMVCKGTSFSVDNISAGGDSYQWTFSGQEIIKHTSEAFDYSFSKGGKQEISLVVKKKSCLSSRLIKPIIVDSLPALPSIVVDNSKSNTLVFGWEEHDWIKSYTLLNETQIRAKFEGVTITKEKNKIIFSNLTSDEELAVKIKFEYDGDCGDLIQDAKGRSKVCAGNLPLKLKASKKVVCKLSGGKTPKIELSVEPKDTHTNGEWFYYEQLLDGIFDPNRYNVGEHNILYRYTLIDNEDCKLEDTLKITIHPSPTLEKPVVTYPECVSVITPAKVEIQSKAGESIWINGKQISNTHELFPGRYRITLQNQFGCPDSRNITINDVSLKPISINGPQLITIEDKPIYSLVSSGDSGLQDIVWSVGGVEMCDGIVNCEAEVNTKNGFIDVCVRGVTVGKKCPQDTCIKVKVATPILFNNPNVFAPNSAAVTNRVLSLASRTGTVRVNYLHVYDRFGNIVYSMSDFEISGDTKKPTRIWDGTVHNEDAPSGIYMYIMEYVDDFGKAHIKTQNITLLR